MPQWDLIFRTKILFPSLATPSSCLDSIFIDFLTLHPFSVDVLPAVAVDLLEHQLHQVELMRLQASHLNPRNKTKPLGSQVLNHVKPFFFPWLHVSFSDLMILPYGREHPPPGFGDDHLVGPLLELCPEVGLVQADPDPVARHLGSLSDADRSL